MDWTRSKYAGINLNWDYDKKEVKLSMKGYVEQVLKQFQYSTPTKYHYRPTKYVLPEHGKKIQYSTEDTWPKLTPLEKESNPKSLPKVPYDGRSVDNTELYALNKPSIKATTATEETYAALIQFLNYIASNLDAMTIYRASNMILLCNSDASYPVATKSRT